MDLAMSNVLVKLERELLGLISCYWTELKKTRQKASQFKFKFINGRKLLLKPQLLVEFVIN
jgi:hypothetical protein